MPHTYKPFQEDKHPGITVRRSFELFRYLLEIPAAAINLSVQRPNSSSKSLAITVSVSAESSCFHLFAASCSHFSAVSSKQSPMASTTGNVTKACGKLSEKADADGC